MSQNVNNGISIRVRLYGSGSQSEDGIRFIFPLAEPAMNLKYLPLDCLPNQIPLNFLST